MLGWYTQEPPTSLGKKEKKEKKGAMEKESFFAKCLSQSSNLCLPRGWSLIARERGEDLFIQQLNDWIEEKQIPCPQTSVTLEEACADFAKLCERDGAWRVDLWYHGLEDEARYGMIIPRWS